MKLFEQHQREIRRHLKAIHKIMNADVSKKNRQTMRVHSDEMIDIYTAAEIKDVSRRRLAELCRRGIPGARKIKNKWHIPKHTLKDMI